MSDIVFVKVLLKCNDNNVTRVKTINKVCNDENMLFHLKC